MAPVMFQSKVFSKEEVAPSFWLVKCEKPSVFEYFAGQYVSLKVSGEGLRRSYSLASWSQLPDLELMVDVTPMGPGSQLILNSQVGGEIEMLGPMGMFIVKESNLEKKLFVATGSGIVPMRPMIHDLLENRQFKGEIKLHWGLHSEENIFWKEEFEQLKSKFSNFSYDIVLSTPDVDWSNCKGHVQDCLTGHNENWNGWEAYVCGNQKMIMDIAALLQTKGIEKEKIYFEKFY
jgi:NAD(P)H-flavin reductase